MLSQKKCSVAIGQIIKVKWSKWSMSISCGEGYHRHLSEPGQSVKEDTRLRVQSHNNPRRLALETTPGKCRREEGDRWCRQAQALLKFYWGCRRTLSMAAMNKWFSITICQGTEAIRHYYLSTQAIMQVNTHTNTHAGTRNPRKICIAKQANKISEGVGPFTNRGTPALEYTSADMNYICLTSDT